MQLLDTVLPESRKYGLYLWIVNQNIQQIRAQLYSAICGNLGPIFCYRVGPDDASKMAELVSPQTSDEVRKKLISFPDYTCAVRKRPHGEDVASRPLLLDPFPKAGESLCDMREVIDYMKGEMEEKYGGAEEATDLVYKSLYDQAFSPGSGETSDTSRVAFMPLHWKILTTGYLKLISDEFSLEFSRIRSELYHKYTWTTSDVQKALNDLVNTGYLTQAFTRQQYVMKGKDAFDNPILVPPDPAIRDQMERARTVIYSLTPGRWSGSRWRWAPRRWETPNMRA